MFDISANFILERFLISLFRNTSFIDPMSTNGGDFYIDLSYELMERWSWGSGDYEPNLGYLRKETIERYAHFVNELKKLEQASLIKIDKIEGDKDLSTISNDTFRELIYSQDVLCTHIRHYKLSYINWMHFLNYISDLVATRSLDEENIFSNIKQNKIVFEKIKQKIIFLEKTNDIILNSDNFKDVNLLASLKELEEGRLVNINGVKIVLEQEDEYINYFKYLVNISYISSSIPLREVEIDKKAYIESLTCVRPVFGSKYNIIINNDYSKPIEVDKNIKSWELLLQLSIDGKVDSDKSFLDFINGSRNQLVKKTRLNKTKVVKIDNNSIVPNIAINNISDKAYKIKINKLNNN